MANDNSIDKPIIIATRVRLKFVGKLIVGIILLLSMICLFAFLPEVWYIWLVFILIIVPITILEVLYAVKNNHKQSKMITYIDNQLTIYDNEKIYINLKDIYDITYKTKRSFIITASFWFTKEYNYGKLILYFKTDDGNGYKLSLKNVLNPDKVFEKIYSLLGWDIDNEE